VIRAAEPDRPDVTAARQDWQENVAPNLDPNRVVFVDETAANTPFGRQYGYGPKGKPVVGRVPHGHDKSLTFTAALRADGLSACQILDGPMNGDRFESYVREVLVPTLRAGDVVVMDNLPCQKQVRVRSLIERAGCRLQLLPPDSPDWNPIEKAFARWKRVLRTDGWRTVPALQAGLRAAQGLFRADECESDIRHCGYGVLATVRPKGL
jgi:transposase